MASGTRSFVTMTTIASCSSDRETNQMTKFVDVKLEQAINGAKRAAARDGVAHAVFNLNMSGARMLVIREADSFAGENRMVAGPFLPESVDG
jgi:hypothetical protein